MLFKLKKIKTTGNIPGGRVSHTAVLHSNSMIVFGGHNYGDDFEFLNDLICLDLINYKLEKKQTTGDIPSPSSGHSAVVYNNKMFVYGGLEDDSWQNADNTVYSLDLELFEWSKVKTEGLVPKFALQHSVALYKDRAV